MSIWYTFLPCISVFLWAINAVCIKIVVDTISPYTFIFLQYAALIPFLFIMKRPQIEWKWLLGISCGWYLFNHLFLAISFGLGMPAGFGMFLHKTCVLFSWIFSYILFQEQPKKSQYFGMAIALIGLFQLIMMHFDATISGLSILYILLSAAFWGFGAACQKKSGTGGSVDLLIWAGALSAFPMFFIILLGTGLDNFIKDIATLTWKNIFYLAYTVIFGLILAGVIWLYAVKKEGILRVSPFILLSPPLTYFLSVVFLNERISLELIGIFSVIIAGLAMTQFETFKVGTLFFKKRS